MASEAISEHLILKKISGGACPQTPLACVCLGTHHPRCPPNLKYLPPPLEGDSGYEKLILVLEANCISNLSPNHTLPPPSLWLVCNQGNHSAVKTTNLFLQCGCVWEGGGGGGGGASLDLLIYACTGHGLNTLRRLQPLQKQRKTSPVSFAACVCILNVVQSTPNLLF